MPDAADVPARLRTLLDSAWRFHKGDVEDAHAPAFDDSSWRRLDLPHDWSIEDLDEPETSGPFTPHAPGGRSTGYTLGAVGWYRRRFPAPLPTAGRRVTLEFEGVYRNADVWVNGLHCGFHPYGYTSFHFDVTDALRDEGQNVLAVRVDTTGRHTRWYSGSGIYRHVWLHSSPAVHVAHQGTWVTTPQVSAESATVRVQTTVGNRSPRGETVLLRTRIIDRRGHQIGEAASEQRLAAGCDVTFDQRVELPRPALWSTQNPALYRAVSRLCGAEGAPDEVTTTFGIRSISFDAEGGFRLNGESLNMRGGCMHHDNGPLGAAAFDRAEERRVELMKANGFNAIRCAHNPPSPAFLDACDRLGMLVIDEAFDQWRKPKNPDDYHQYFDEWWRQDIDSMVLRDRNHPSVVMWSTGNEIPERYSDEGVETSRTLAERVRELDPTRPVTSGVNEISEDSDELFATLDVCGYNYGCPSYQQDHERVPERVIYGSETAPSRPCTCWGGVADHAYVVGDFVWTGMDYLGEAAVGWTAFKRPDVWPWKTAFCGDIDLCGFTRPGGRSRQVLWGVGPRVALFVHSPRPRFGEECDSFWGWGDVQECWNWPGLEGQALTVDAYCACPQVRLSLNGRDLGAGQAVECCKFRWTVPYQPGTLQAVACDDGEPVSECTLVTAQQPARLGLRPDRSAIACDGQDLCFVVAEVLDANGQRHPAAQNVVHFTVDGPAAIAAVGSGNPISGESFQQPYRAAFEGRCLLVLRAGAQPGKVRIRADADGLQPAEVGIRTE